MMAQRLRSVLDVITTLALLVASAAIIWPYVRPRSGAEAPPIPTAPVALDPGAIKGETTAGVGMAVFSDFECPYCSRFALEVQPELERRYVKDGRVLIAFKHFPLRIHPRAKRAAQAANCAKPLQGFWTVHDALFDVAEPLTEERIVALGEELALGAEWTECMKTRNRQDMPNADEAAALGLKSTPTVLVGSLGAGLALTVTRIIVGAQSLETYTETIEALLAGK